MRSYCGYTILLLLLGGLPTAYGQLWLAEDGTLLRGRPAQRAVYREVYGVRQAIVYACDSVAREEEIRVLAGGKLVWRGVVKFWDEARVAVRSDYNGYGERVRGMRYVWDSAGRRVEERTVHYPAGAEGGALNGECAMRFDDSLVYLRQYVYDGAGRVVEERSGTPADPQVMRYSYDTRGNRVVEVLATDTYPGYFAAFCDEGREIFYKTIFRYNDGDLLVEQANYYVSPQGCDAPPGRQGLVRIGDKQMFAYDSGGKRSPAARYTLFRDADGREVMVGEVR